MKMKLYYTLKNKWQMETKEYNERIYFKYSMHLHYGYSILAIKMTLNSLEVLHSLLTVEQVIWLSALYYTRTATCRFITKMYDTKIETL